MYRFYLFLCLFYINPRAAIAQPTADLQPNLVPNGGFEEFGGYPIGWFYKGSDFDAVVKYWTSPTTASPDAYGTRVRVPASWAEKGFGKQTPHGGQNMAGITVYGCSNGKPHCREYVQIQLREPLVVGQNYLFEMYVATLPKGLRINNLGAFLTDKKTRILGEERLAVTPTVVATKIVDPKGGGWQRLSFKFTAATEAEWLIIGNFSTDEATLIMSPPSVSNLNFAYYYLDDVSIRKTEPMLPVPIRDDDLTRQPLEVGKTVVLKNIYFDSDKADLLPRSNVELNKLFQILTDNPTLEIEIIGHTDNIGDADYNLNLSRRRAAMVMEYLIKNGIESRRLRSTGFGATQPLAPNDAEETRQLNRRVAFKILKK